jgi:hypothetical protein
MSSRLLVKQAVRSLTEDDRERNRSLYELGATPGYTEAGRQAVSGGLWGAGLIGLPVAGGTMGLSHMLLSRSGLPAYAAKMGYGASAVLAAILGLKEAKIGVVPGALASGVFGATDPSDARKELYSISKGYDPEVSSPAAKSYAGKALSDAARAREL